MARSVILERLERTFLVPGGTGLWPGASGVPPDALVGTRGIARPEAGRDRRDACSTSRPSLLTALKAFSFLAGLVFFQFLAVGAPEGWSTVDRLPTPSWDGHVLLFRGPQGNLAVTPLSDDVIRFRFTPFNAFGRDHSYAVINRDLGPCAAAVSIETDLSTLTTATLKITVKQDPLRVEINGADGESLDADDPDRGIAVAGGSFQVAKRLREDEHVYGFGEKNGRLDKRGWALGGYNYAMWNTDTYRYDSSTDPLYASIPFYMVTRKGRAHGIFLDNTWRTTFDVGRERRDLLTFGAAGGDLDYYFINGPAPEQVVQRYAALTGKMPLPPEWSLGYNQCRYSYYPEARVRLVADTFRVKKIPADVIWLDIHYQDNFKPFTWNLERFPHPKQMISDLKAQGFRTVCIVDPHPKVEKGYYPYDSGMAGNCFVKRPDGSVYEGPVWPSKAEIDPGPSVFPDFSRPDVRRWWGGLYKMFTDEGVAGIWNDMNEPCVFSPPSWTMPLDLVFDNEGQPASAREIHNVYGQLMSRSTFEGLGRLRPQERPFVLTRATFAGGQRYAAVWPGDNSADWSSLRQSIPTLLGLGLSGFPFVGCDIGGFVGADSPELYTRWLQLGVFYPFMRSHSDLGSPDKEPWSFGTDYEAINKRMIELRYEMLPYIYNVMRQASVTGVPAMRPLFMEFPAEEDAAAIDDEFLFGHDLLVAPVLYQGQSEREVYLPKSNWYDYWTGQLYAGGQSIHMPVTINSLPLFVRGGGFIYEQPVVQNTTEMAGNPLRILIAPATNSESTLYEDDGETIAYRSGKYVTRKLSQTSSPTAVTVEISPPEGPYRPAARDLFVETWMVESPKSILLVENSGAPILLARVDARALTNFASGWSYAAQQVTIKTPDRFDAEGFIIQRR